MGFKEFLLNGTVGNTLLEVFDSYDPTKIISKTTSDTHARWIAELSTGDVLEFVATVINDESNYSGDPVWDIVFSVNDIYRAGVNDSVNANEVFSFVLSFLNELRVNGAKAFAFTADSDHQNIYRVLTKRFARGMHMFEETKSFNGEAICFLIFAKDAKIGYTDTVSGNLRMFSFDYLDTRGGSLKITIRDDTFISASNNIEPFLHFLEKHSKSTLEEIGEKIRTEYGGLRLDIKGPHRLYKNDFEHYFDVTLSSGLDIDSGFVTKNHWRANGINEDNQSVDVSVEKTHSGYWNMVGCDEISHKEVITRFIDDASPDLLVIGYSNDDFKLDVLDFDWYTAYNFDDSERLLVKVGFNIPLTTSADAITFDLIKPFGFTIYVDQVDEGGFPTTKLSGHGPLFNFYDEEVIRFFQETNLIKEVVRGIKQISGNNKEFDVMELPDVMVDLLSNYFKL